MSFISPSMSVNYSDVEGKQACQSATEAVYRQMSLEVWKNTGQAQSQTFPGLSVAHHRVLVSLGIASLAVPAHTGATECKGLQPALMTPRNWGHAGARLSHGCCFLQSSHHRGLSAPEERADSARQRDVQIGHWTK